MCRAFLTLVVGLLLLLSGGASAFAQGDFIWEGTQESKLFSLTGPKKIRITTEGVFINGSFKPAWRLSKNDACLYGISNFPDSGYFSTSKVWNSVLRKFDFSECSSIRDRAKYSHIFGRTFSTRVKKAQSKAQMLPMKISVLLMTFWYAVRQEFQAHNNGRTWNMQQKRFQGA